MNQHMFKVFLGFVFFVSYFYVLLYNGTMKLQVEGLSDEVHFLRASQEKVLLRDWSESRETVMQRRYGT